MKWRTRVILSAFVAHMGFPLKFNDKVKFDIYSVNKYPMVQRVNETWVWRRFTFGPRPCLSIYCFWLGMKIGRAFERDGNRRLYGAYRGQ